MACFASVVTSSADLFVGVDTNSGFNGGCGGINGGGEVIFGVVVSGGLVDGSSCAFLGISLDDITSTWLHFQFPFAWLT